MVRRRAKAQTKRTEWENEEKKRFIFRKKGKSMGLFDVDENKVKALYHRAWAESGMSSVNPRKVPYLDHTLTAYARQNGCSYDEALRVAKTGKKK